MNMLGSAHRPHAAADDLKAEAVENVVLAARYCEFSKSANKYFVAHHPVTAADELTNESVANVVISARSLGE